MIKVFLVEDEIVIRESIHRMIPWAEYGFEFAGEANDGEMALPMIRKLRPDLLITDIKMPFMDGLTLSRLVKKEMPETKIIIVSGYDDFDYARRAINVGVEQYLLKPIRKADFLEVLQGVYEKYQKENEQKIYYEKFCNEIQEYEKNYRRDFFDMIVSPETELQEIYEHADSLGIDIMAQCYNMVLFTMNAKEDKQMIDDCYSQDMGDLQEQIDALFPDSEEYLMFRNQVYNYAVLVKGDREQIAERTLKCVKKLQAVFEEKDDTVDWAVCCGNGVDRLSRLPECYGGAMRTFTYRYMGYRRVIEAEKLPGQGGNSEEEFNIRKLDSGVVDSAIIRNFLCNALEEEVETFTRNYLEMIGTAALCSKMFRQYVLLNVHFCTVSFVQMLGYEKDDIVDYLGQVCNDHTVSEAEMEASIADILRQGIRLREDNAKGKNQNAISRAMQYMEANFCDDSLTLNVVACVANVSANHFSTLFSQEKGQTFIEYLTGLRMQRAKELLRCTDKRSGEIALEVGYKDSHYFSFLFKKTQGCTPSEYRSRKEEDRIKE